MNSLSSWMRRVSKRTYAVAAIAAAVVAIPATLFAWGPDRPTFTMAHPADYVTFNSITDNPMHGDERNFVQIRDYTANGVFGEEVSLTAGKEYEVYVFYHNNASSSLNDAAHHYAGIATGTFMRAQLPTTVAAGAQSHVNGFVGATNAKPQQVWDEAQMKNNTATALTVTPVPHSAVVTSVGAVNGKTLSDSLYTTTGAPIGFDALDGKLPGCNHYSGYVKFRFKVTAPTQPKPAVTITKTVNGKEHDVVTAGKQFTYEVTVKNTGNVDLVNAKVSDKAPAGITFVKADKGTIANNTWTTTVTLKPGQSASFKLTAVAKEYMAGTAVNKVCVDASEIPGVDDACDTASTSMPKPGDVTVCRLSDKTVVTISQAEYNANKAKYSTNMKDCETTPAPVVELPHTGIADGIMAVLGVGSIVGVAAAFVASRRAL